MALVFLLVAVSHVGRTESPGVIDPLRLTLSRHVFSPLQGMSRETWRSVLRDGGGVDAPYRARAALQSGLAPVNSVLAAIEESRFGSRIDRTLVQAPLFILGHWRHGTTHLHNLLANDPQFTFPTLYQTLYPRTFLSTEALVPTIGRPLLLRMRPHDSVALGFGVPNEDEIALCNDSGLSPYLSWVFPRRAEIFDPYLTFAGVADAVVGRWKSSLERFLKKLAVRDPRPAVLKSPTHTARIALLREVFPDARFIHIRRDPYDVFRSTRHMIAMTMPYWRLQSGSVEDDARILRTYRAMYEAFLSQRGEIPAGGFCSVDYEDLERDPLGALEAIYGELGFPGLDVARPRFQTYLDSLGGYRKNEHPPLPEPLRRRVAAEWGPYHEATAPQGVWALSRTGPGAA